MLEVNDDNWIMEVIGSDEPIIVDFWAPWCGPCKMIAPILEEIDDETSFKVAKLNVDENPKTTQEYFVNSIPTLILFSNGKQKERIQGFKPKKELIRILKESV